MIEIKNLFLKYIREYYALYDISLCIKKGERVALIGKEASGKTTLLRVLAKLEKFDSGEVYVKDISLKKLDFKHDINLGYVSAVPVFFNNKTVYENFKYVLKQRNYNPGEIEDIINKNMIEYSIEKFRNTKVKDLTEYEKYVMSLVRLSLRSLDIVLIDNVFEKLSQNEQADLLKLITSIFADRNETTVLIAADNENLLNDFCTRKIFFENGSII